ncbi:hypothetical protein FUAX_55480 (plasmid) [Fulvitalea axinellae]|uniref:Response regulator n=1 Tax=Fulvitalea axinellae TaxID=1182444 RepID=A0AAU9CME0_9BACT|nr:hypothetical protein FUAX_55480 [Fulvitalea axinellae]
MDLQRQAPIKTLLVDDAPSNNFIDNAEGEGLDLKPVSNVEGMRKILESENHVFDAVILDVRFYEDQSEGRTTQAAYRQAREYLSNKDLKYFTYTGQDSIKKDDSFHETYGFDDDENFLYKKGIDEDKLIEDIKSFVTEEGENWKLKNRHTHIFSASAIDHLQLLEPDLLKLAKTLDSINTGDQDVEDLFNCCRRIIENIFKACATQEILPNHFVANEVALNPSSRFLSGQKAEHNYIAFKPTGGHSPFPKSVANVLRSILEITNEGSHSNLTQDCTPHQRTYLLTAVINNLFALVSWTKDHLSKNDLQKKQWSQTSVSRRRRGSRN